MSAAVFQWFAFPTTNTAILRWVLASSLLYIAVRELVSWIKNSKVVDISFSLAGDAVMFSTSLLLLMGAWNEPTMRAIGDNALFLLFAGLVGFHGTVRAIFR